PACWLRSCYRPCRTTSLSFATKILITAPSGLLSQNGGVTSYAPTLPDGDLGTHLFSITYITLRTDRHAATRICTDLSPAALQPLASTKTLLTLRTCECNTCVLLRKLLSSHMTHLLSGLLEDDRLLVALPSSY